MESATKTSKKWSDKQRENFRQTMAKKKAQKKFLTMSKTKPKVKRSGMIPFHAIPDDPPRTHKVKTQPSNDRVQLARELIAFARELLK